MLRVNPFGSILSGADFANSDLSEAKFRKTKFWGASARNAKIPKGAGSMLWFSTLFSKAKEKQVEVEDVKEKARQKRIDDLEKKAEKRPPHASGKR